MDSIRASEAPDAGSIPAEATKFKSFASLPEQDDLYCIQSVFNKDNDDKRN